MFSPRIFTPLIKRFSSDSFVVMDIGTFGVKAMRIEMNGKEAEIADHSRKNHSGGDMVGTGGIDAQKLIETCNEALKALRGGGRRSFPAKRTVISVGGGVMHGKTLPQSYIRENPRGEIDKVEFANILQKVQQRNFEAIRKEFKKDTGRSELEVRLINASVQEVKIDGYQVVNPVGFKGKEVIVSLFNSYIAKEHLDNLMAVIESLKLEVDSIICGPFAVFNAVLKKDKSTGDFILVDIGGSVTEVALSRKGRLEDIRSIPMGGASFTRSISDGLKVGFWEAENIKYSLYEKRVSESVAKKLEELIMKDVEVFLRGLAAVLSDFSHLSLLPSKIYIYGGGSMVPFLLRTLNQKEWRDALSFFSPPTVEILESETGILSNINKEKEGELSGSQWTAPFAIANTFIEEKTVDSEITKTLRRSLRLVQG